MLARLLTPADFGVFAVALAVTAFAMHVNDAGIIAACVQWRGKLEDMAPTGAVIASLSSVLVYGVLWFSAPAFATLSGAPEAAPVVRLLTLVIVVDGITAVRAAALMRRFEQDRLTKANMVGMLANAAVALPLAFAGAGAYSFASGQLAGSVVTGVFVFKMANLPIRFGFDREITKKLLRFGLPLAASLGIEAVLLNADFVIVGNVLGVVALGFYLLAFNVSSWVPGLIGDRGALRVDPRLLAAGRAGPRGARVGCRRSVPFLVSAVLPIAVVMATLAPQLVDFLYGDKWGPSAVALRLSDRADGRPHADIVGVRHPYLVGVHQVHRVAERGLGRRPGSRTVDRDPPGWHPRCGDRARRRGGIRRASAGGVGPAPSGRQPSADPACARAADDRRLRLAAAVIMMIDRSSAAIRLWSCGFGWGAPG